MTRNKFTCDLCEQEYRFQFTTDQWLDHRPEKATNWHDGYETWIDLKVEPFTKFTGDLTRVLIKKKGDFCNPCHHKLAKKATEISDFIRGISELWKDGETVEQFTKRLKETN